VTCGARTRWCTPSTSRPSRTVTGDGCGDFAGLTERVDYVSGLGVTCLWLRPFYPSPRRDDGYDVTDFYEIDPSFGTLGDFVEFVRTARDRGMRVIVDWSSTTPPSGTRGSKAPAVTRSLPIETSTCGATGLPNAKGPAFPDDEASIWSRDPVAGRYYLHRFYREQADLNWANPRVREEIHKVMGFWLQLGVSGFRVDAVPFLLSEEKLPEGVEQDPQTHDPHMLLRELRGFLSRRRGDAVFLGEVNLPPVDQFAYFGGAHGDELHMIFNFALNQQPCLALARSDAAPIRRFLSEVPELSRGSQWANFVRNHDELTLDQLSPAERDEVFESFGKDPDLQVFGRGLRRRLPPHAAGRPPKDRAGLQPHVLLAGHTGAAVRRGDRHGGTSGAARPQARCGRRCSGPASPWGFLIRRGCPALPAARPPASTGRNTSTWPISVGIRTHCSTGWSG
jgi:glycosidase